MTKTKTALPVPTPGCPATPNTAYISVDDLAAELGTEQAVAVRLHEVGVAMIEAYAPCAPQVLKNEALIRFAGYLRGKQYGDMRQLSIGGITLEPSNHSSMFRLCGAAALLTLWKVRRGGVIG